jgi:nucleotide-binding universal stress UspA family protein
MDELLDDDLTLLRQAECSVLMVSRTQRMIQTILVNYQGGLEGKMALRLAGGWGEKTSARVVVLSIDSDPAQAASLTQVATQYLKGYALAEVKTIERSGDPNSELEILDVVREESADLIVVGAEPYGLLARILDQDVAEDLALATELPLLIAR